VYSQQKNIVANRIIACIWGKTGQFAGEGKRDPTLQERVKKNQKKAITNIVIAKVYTKCTKINDKLRPLFGNV
jgi:hypothetical protein